MKTKFLKILVIILTAAMLTGLVAGCTGAAITTATDQTTTPSTKGTTTAAPTTTGTTESAIDLNERPTLKRLSAAANFDLAEDYVGKLVQELTGYPVEYYTLPTTNSTEILLLKVASGEQYDFMKISGIQYALLNAQGALLPVDDMLTDYGSNIMPGITENAWKSVTTDGVKYGVPFEDGDSNQPIEDRIDYGVTYFGLAVRTDVKEQLGLTLPTNLEDFKTFLQTLKESTGKAPFTGNDAYIASIMSAYGISNDALWYDVGGTYTPILKMPELVDYLSFVQGLYANGLMDEEWPINTAENINIKFSNGTCPVRNATWFYDIPALLPALQENNAEAQIEFITLLSKDAASKPVKWIAGSANTVLCFPINSKYPEHVMNYYNILSDQDTFKRMYIGEEGVSFEIKNGDYYPILPEFTNYNNAVTYYGFIDTAIRNMYWQARARKTPEMAVAVDQLTANLGNQEIKFSYAGYATGLTEYQVYAASLNKLVSDGITKAIADGTPAQDAITALIAQWDTMGGPELEASMQDWYTNWR